jgi:hypothetical protein
MKSSRRLSSGLGLAAGADERQLRTELPRHAIGFQSPIALTINVRIARITDEIMSSEYITLSYDRGYFLTWEKHFMVINPSPSSN